MGYIKLHKQILEHWVFDNDTSLKAWLYLLCNANYSDTIETIKNQKVILKRGQLTISLRTLALKLKCSLQTLRTILYNLEKDNMINIQSTHLFTIVTICNYESYQNGKKANQHTPNTPTNTLTNTLNPLENIKVTEQPNTPTNTPTNTLNENPYHYIKEIIIKIIKSKHIDSEKFLETWSEWTEFRKQKRNQLTEMMIKKQIKMLESYDTDTAIEILNQSIMNGWTGLFPLTNNKTEPKIYKSRFHLEPQDYSRKIL